MMHADRMNLTQVAFADDLDAGLPGPAGLGVSTVGRFDLEPARRRLDSANGARPVVDPIDRAARLQARVDALLAERDPRTGARFVVGASAEWRSVLTQATQAAPTPTTVLLLGESGTGKEVLARFLHRASSRDRGPFVAVNCAALPEQLLEAELFGYERGAFTGATQSKPGQIEQAAGGTLFLDEIAEMSPAAQAKLLRVLQEREFQRLGGTRVLKADVRIIAATNRNLERAIVNGQFREDLFYRLNVFPIRLPALRDRRDDVLPLADALLDVIGREIGRPSAGLTSEARATLLAHQWPGNVRELRNTLERAVILCDGGPITAEHVGKGTGGFSTDSTSGGTGQAGPAPGACPVPPEAGSVEKPPVPFLCKPVEKTPVPLSAADLQSMERAMIEQALAVARFNKSRAAKALGLTRPQLYVRLRRFGL